MCRRHSGTSLSSSGTTNREGRTPITPLVQNKGRVLRKKEHVEFQLCHRDLHRLRSHCHMERDGRAGESKGLVLGDPQAHAGVQVRKKDGAVVEPAWVRLTCPRSALTVLRGVLLRASAPHSQCHQHRKIKQCATREPHCWKSGQMKGLQDYCPG